MLFTENQTNCT